MMKSLAAAVFCLMVLAWSAGESRGADKKMTPSQYQQGGQVYKPPTKTQVGCIGEMTIDVAMTNDFLKNNVAMIATAVNVNKVKLTVYGSNIIGETVHCYYKSASGDIPNLVYQFPCKNAEKNPVSYPHSYFCTQ